MSIKELLELFSSIVTQRKSNRSYIFKQITEKWSELERTHIIFTSAARAVWAECVKAIEAFENSDDIDGIVNEFHRQIEIISSSRFEGRHLRMAQFEEAKVYLEFDWSEKHYLIKNVPDDLVYFIQVFMISYCKYFYGESFQIDAIYDHELARMLRKIESTIDGRKISKIRHDKDSVVDDIKRIREMSDMLISDLDARWRRVCFDFSRLKLEFIHNLGIAVQ